MRIEYPMDSSEILSSENYSIKSLQSTASMHQKRGMSVGNSNVNNRTRNQFNCGITPKMSIISIRSNSLNEPCDYNASIHHYLELPYQKYDTNLVSGSKFIFKSKPPPLNKPKVRFQETDEFI
jgi:hypothetical protein